MCEYLKLIPVWMNRKRVLLIFKIKTLYFNGDLITVYGKINYYFITFVSQKNRCKNIYFLNQYWQH